MPDKPLDPNIEPEDTKGKKEEFPSDSGLGNLPPLSDFDSGEKSDIDSKLPPLSAFDSDSLKKTEDSSKEPFEGSLPPISELDVVIPEPTGGNIKGPFSDLDTHSTPGGIPGVLQTPPQTPATPPPSAPRRTSFQDLAADSDFSPETPEIGPGPVSLESGLETPVADSAFGGTSKGGVFDIKTDQVGIGPTPTITSAPTQIMESPFFGGPQSPSPSFGEPQSPSPMFGGAQTPSPDFGPADSGLGIGAPPGGGLGTDIFGSPGVVGVETPIPEFTAPTGPGVTPPIAPTTATQAPVEQPPAEGKPRRKITQVLILPVLIIVGFVIGLIASPFLATYLPLPNPHAEEIARLEQQLKNKDNEIRQLRSLPPGTTISEEDVRRLQSELEDVNNRIKNARQELENLNNQINEKTTNLRAIEADIAAKNEQFVTAQEAYENLLNETEIVKARQTGLLAEIERLTKQVGQLEEAQARNIAIKEAFLHDLDKLIIQIKESIPLTPEKYSLSERLARAEELRQRAEQANWITPELQKEFSNLYLSEIELSKKQEYFYAKIPVKDSLGTPVNKWAECLMKGTWGVYYRTLDGKNIGVFQNTKPGAITPVWGFQEDLPPHIKTQIEQEIALARPPDFEQIISRLAEKQLSAEPKSTLQRLYSSL